MNIIFLVQSEHHNSMLIGLVTGALLTILGGVIQFCLQRSLKSKSLVDEVRSVFLYINMVLCLERSSIANLEKILESFNTGNPTHKKLQRFQFTPISFLVSEKYIQKLLFFDKLLKSLKYAEMIQKITLAESSYRKCIDLINQYNECLSDEKISAEGQLRDISSFSAASLQDCIILACKEAKIINERARDSMGDVFTELFGKDIKLATVETEVVKSTEV